MYDSLTDFLSTFSVDHPALWALLVMATVAFTSLAFFVLWEFLPRFGMVPGVLAKTRRRRAR